MSVDFSTLKVGDVIGVQYSPSSTFRLVTVTNVNGHGHVTIGSHVYNKHKQSKNSQGKWTFSREIFLPVEKAEEYNRQKERQSLHHHSVCAVAGFLAGQKTGYGNYHLTSADKEELLKLVNAIEPTDTPRILPTN